MAIQLESIIPQDEEYSPALRKSTRGMRMRSGRQQTAAMSNGFDITGYLNGFAGNYGILTGAFVVLFLFLWVFLYSFNFEFVQHGKDTKYEGEPDTVKVFFWALFLTILFVVGSMLWMTMW